MSKKWIVVLSIFSLVAIVVYFAKTKYDDLHSATTQGLVFGKAFGESLNQSQCTTGLRFRYMGCNDLECELSATGFINGCMLAANKDDFCIRVPKLDDVKASLDWVNDTCNGIGLHNTKCKNYLHTFVQLCTEQITGRRASKAELFQNGFKRAQ